MIFIGERCSNFLYSKTHLCKWIHISEISEVCERLFACRLSRVKNQEEEKKRGWKKTSADRITAGKLDKQDELAQTDRKHKYKYPEDKCGRWATLGGGGDKHKDR